MRIINFQKFADDVADFLMPGAAINTIWASADAGGYTCLKPLNPPLQLRDLRPQRLRRAEKARGLAETALRAAGPR